MTVFVIDASVVVASLTPERESIDARPIMIEARAAGVTGPPHLTLEVVNALVMKSRRGLIDADYRRDALSRLADYGIRLDTPRDPNAVVDRVIALSDRHGLTAYDAAYLELAQRLGANLASFDRNLRRAAVAEGVAVTPA